MHRCVIKVSVSHTSTAMTDQNISDLEKEVKGGCWLLRLRQTEMPTLAENCLETSTSKLKGFKKSKAMAKPVSSGESF